ncbi:hypothetical protein CPK_ORF00346 [Chlamydia pneumoniae LPCoLN]|uniref:Uncharacterized protein n=1 Tax=Chlamydia pneumoniae TaxID=83558 RepID=Q9K1V1_CHLPN|nr:hypothetical protein CP_0930 [Chlamydia pneumoniae AR39]ACZ32823.1 hypothetical protein CPK_ORF00346 [Chlamydia pneumoniae LPCoLN]CRI33465.1 Uncharacterized protein BN1224_Wien1_A_09720 [Chlamydia pneumoniae]CRI39717.1 Uncharacterized protein BN1224_CWL011_A_09810 [Chlamydia pneumoniae]CRI40849.1 Uncharacterized protein CWL029c_F_00960 [Chlamydia pneumoniae]
MNKYEILRIFMRFFISFEKKEICYLFSYKIFESKNHRSRKFILLG